MIGMVVSAEYAAKRARMITIGSVIVKNALSVALLDQTPINGLVADALNVEPRKTFETKAIDGMETYASLVALPEAMYMIGTVQVPAVRSNSQPISQVEYEQMR